MSLALLAAACASEPVSLPTAPPPNHGTYKVGVPYQIDGTWYYPREDPNYDETGVASWYGPNFYDKATANGEIYHAGDLTAAHRTLPMPVNVRVTNLDNGRSIIVRVNDRGPFAKGRIIDLSEHAAELLGYKTAGTARVRVQFVSRADLDGGRPPPDLTPPEVASAVPAAPTSRVAATALDAVPGTAVAPPVTARPLPSPLPPVTSADVAVATQPTGVVTQTAPVATRLYVQAGAFTTYQNAARLVQRLGNGLQISSITHNGQTVYRVRSGPYDDIGDADSALARVTAAGSNDARIVVDN
ncbi:MAG: septal ring lytic transglycosylase RlpA family protein [Alphaproteobacteria bacterium]|nr:septal ring lytic transglycosylase RlpA family protein [Alphaproteobacteria bacterium]MBL7098480.1 septal ring lytic transglycosylase RlpA family protein [Alphaproteobacteria bacterium]